MTIGGPTFYEHSSPDQCGSKGCTEPRAPERYVCADHAIEMDRIREEFREASQRKMRRSKRGSTCCFPGCYEARVPPQAFCFAHSDQVEGE